ncbi:hypothetical protein [Tessaracoccus aquimaris]|uniref:hypothetical protein n=1 Tax=Tessaracoccus aquimaris TaxID=1332264 RepID=UPI001D0445D4|nr:hypothetical protein [Tessaracoccus aquimaris]
MWCTATRRSSNWTPSSGLHRRHRGDARPLRLRPGAAVQRDPEDDLERYRRLSADRRVDGVILNELTLDDPRVALVQELGLPAVGINPDPGFPSRTCARTTRAACVNSSPR